MEPIIDFHTHPFQRMENCLNFYPEMPELDAFGMRKQLEDAGITHICGSVLRKNFRLDGFGSLRSLNREALALRNALGDFYTPGFHIHPAFVQESCREVEDMQAQGVNLMGELVPYIHGWGDFNDRNWFAILEAAAPGMLCCYHTPFEYDMTELLRTYPEITFIAAHPGDRERVEEHIALMKRHDNLYLDLSGTGLFRFGVLKHLISQVGDERILFGTDYPICNPRMYVQAVHGEDIPASSKRRIFFGNARTLIG